MICLYYCRRGDNIELKYSLRSLEEFLNLPVVIVGGKPDWCHPDFFLEHKTNFGKCMDARSHIANGLSWIASNADKVIASAQHKQAKAEELRKAQKIESHSTRILSSYEDLLSAGGDEASDFGIEPDDDVCIMMDDVYLAAPFWKNHSKGTLRDCWKLSVKKYGKTAYNEILRKTLEFLEQLGITNPINYDSHAPFFCNRKKVQEAFRLMGKTNKQLAFRSVYGNLYKAKHVPARDIKFRTNDKVKLYSVMSSTDLELQNVLPILERRYPNISRHELMS